MLCVTFLMFHFDFPNKKKELFIWKFLLCISYYMLILISSRNHISYSISVMERGRWVPCHHSLEHPRAMELLRVAVNTLQKQLRTNDKGWSSSLGVGHGINNPSP
jgi:hypothetical protein